MNPVRVLYVQRPAGGGSMTGLLDMVRLMGRRPVEPLVLFYQDNEYLDRFRSLGVEVAVLNDRPGATPLPEGAGGAVRPLKRLRPIRELNRLLRRDRRIARSIGEQIEEFAPDLIHHNDNPHSDRASILAAWRAGLPQVCHVRYTDSLYPPVDRFLARAADRLVFVSGWIREVTASELGGIAERGSVVYDPVDYEEFSPDSGAREAVAEELGVARERPLVANVGRLVEWKGQDVFLRAATEVLEEFPETLFFLVGGASSAGEGSTYADRLRGQAERLGITDSVVFTGRRDDVPRLMAAADVIVHSSTRPEPFGRVLVEALSCATPVVASAAGGPREIVDHGETGLLTAPGEPSEMAGAVKNLLADLSAAREMGARGRETVMARFGTETFTRGIESTYARVLARQSGNRESKPGWDNG